MEWQSEIKTGAPAYFGYPDSAVLTIDQVAAWQQVGVDTAEKMDFPFFWAGKRRRYLFKHCVEHLATLEKNALPNAA